VVAVAVELDGQVVVGPAAVDVAAAGGAVGDREREAGLLQHLQEAALEDAEGDVDVAVDHRSELLRTRSPLDDQLDLLRRGAVADPGLVEGSSEGIEGEHGRQGDHRARGRRHGDAAPHDRVALVEPTRSFRPHSFNAPFSPRHHLRRGSHETAHEPQ